MKRKILAILSLLLFSALLPIMPRARADVVHDVAVTDVTPSKTVVGQGYNIDINVTVANQGDDPETFNVTFYSNTTVIGIQKLNGVLNGTSTVLTFTWNTIGFAYGNYTISAVADTVPDETNTANNSFTDGEIYVSIPGDINRDGMVDVFDATILANACGSSLGNPRWNTDADLNQNGVVDVFDFTILARHA
jgi:hypothetical protein